MKNIILQTIITITVMASSSHALACSYFIDDIKVQNDLGINALNEVGVSIGDIQNVAISDYNWFESISTPMCPEELTFEGTFNIAFTRATESGSSFCSTILKVTKVASWIGDRDENYSITTIRPLTCTL